MLPFYTKWLSVEDYGVVDIISIYAVFLLGIVTFSLSEAIFVFPKGESKEKQTQYFSSGLFFVLLSLIATAIIFLSANFLFKSFHISNAFSENLWAIYLIILTSFLQNYLQQFSRSIEKIKVYALSGLILTASTALLAFKLIPIYGVYGFVLAQILSLMIAALYTLIFSNAYSFLSIHAVKKEYYIEMLRYSVPLIPNGIMWWLVGAFNRPIIEHYSNLNDIGLFAIANKFPSLITMIFSVFTISWQASVLEEFNSPGYKKFYNNVLRLIFILLTLLSCALSIFSHSIVSLMADPKFIEAWKIVPFLGLAVLFSSLAGFVGTNFSAARQSKYYFYSSIWAASTSVIFNFLLIPFFGILGAAISTILSFKIMAISRIIYSWKYVKISNLYVYIVMTAINALVILTIFVIQNTALKIFYLFILFILLVYINKGVLLELKGVLLKIKRNKKIS